MVEISQTTSQMHIAPQIANHCWQCAPDDAIILCGYQTKTTSRWRCHWNFWILLHMFCSNCSNATSGWLDRRLGISGRAYSKSTCGAYDNYWRGPFFLLKGFSERKFSRRRSAHLVEMSFCKTLAQSARKHVSISRLSIYAQSEIILMCVCNPHTNDSIIFSQLSLGCRSVYWCIWRKTQKSWHVRVHYQNRDSKCYVSE